MSRGLQAMCRSDQTLHHKRRSAQHPNHGLTRPLVPAMGQHDPLDGYVTFLQLRTTAVQLPRAMREPGVDTGVRHFGVMIRDGQWATDDPLGIGGLLVDAYRLHQLQQQGALADEELSGELLAAALNGLQHYVQRGESALPTEYRLAFRELGLVIGLHAVERMWQTAAGRDAAALAHPELRAQLEALRRYLPLAREIESFWRDPEHRRATTWLEHRDINDVMLATGLAPEGFLVLSPSRRAARGASTSARGLWRRPASPGRASTSSTSPRPSSTSRIHGRRSAPRPTRCGPAG